MYEVICSHNDLIVFSNVTFYHVLSV